MATKSLISTAATKSLVEKFEGYIKDHSKSCEVKFLKGKEQAKTESVERDQPNEQHQPNEIKSDVMVKRESSEVKSGSVGTSSTFEVLSLTDQVKGWQSFIALFYDASSKGSEDANAMKPLSDEQIRAIVHILDEDQRQVLLKEMKYSMQKYTECKERKEVEYKHQSVSVLAMENKGILTAEYIESMLSDMKVDVLSVGSARPVHSEDGVMSRYVARYPVYILGQPDGVTAAVKTYFSNLDTRLYNNMVTLDDAGKLSISVVF